MKKFCAQLIPLLLIVFFSCDNCEHGFAPHPLTDSSLVSIIDCSNVSGYRFDSAKINTASISGDILSINISYSGGCERHDFRLLICDAWLKSNPPQVLIFLTHDSHNDLCEAYITKTISFPLDELKLEYQRRDGVHGAILIQLFAPKSVSPYTPYLRYDF